MTTNQKWTNVISTGVKSCIFLLVFRNCLLVLTNRRVITNDLFCYINFVNTLSSNVTQNFSLHKYDTYDIIILITSLSEKWCLMPSHIFRPIPKLTRCSKQTFMSTNVTSTFQSSLLLFVMVVHNLFFNRFLFQIAFSLPEQREKNAYDCVCDTLWKCKVQMNEVYNEVYPKGITIQVEKEMDSWISEIHAIAIPVVVCSSESIYFSKEKFGATRNCIFS